MSTIQLTKDSPTTLVLRRTLNASVERVFDAWLDPQALRAFMGGEKHRVVDVTVDPRVGGRYRITNDTDQGAMIVGGVYREIDRPNRIAMTWTWEEDTKEEEHETLLTLDFRAIGAKTELVLTHENLRSEQSRDGHAEGWTDIFENLARRFPDAA